MSLVRYSFPALLLALSGSIFTQSAAPPACPFKAAELQSAFGVVFAEGQGDATDPAVHYVRGPLSVELPILGTYYKDLANKQKDMLTLRDKLAKLRRFP